MVLVLLALAAGVAAGYARGGRLRRLGTDLPARNRLILTAFGAYVVGVAGGWVWSPLLPIMSALCWIILGYYAWLNRHLSGARLVAAGLVVNGLAIALNGGMPVSESAADRAGAGRPVLSEATVAGDEAAVPWLGKVVPVAFPPRPEVVSPGDIAVAAGSAVLLATGMKRPAPARQQRPAAAVRPQRRPPPRPATLPPPPPTDPVPAEATEPPSAHATMVRRVTR